VSLESGGKTLLDLNIKQQNTSFPGHVVWDEATITGHNGHTSLLLEFLLM